jgi:hypothetical protein
VFNVPVNVQVPMMLELNYWIRSCPGDSTPYGPGSMDVKDMGFGKLLWDSQYRIWKAEQYFTVFMVAMTSGRPFQLRQTSNGFASSSTGQGLNKSLLMTPDFKQEDRWTAALAETAQGPLDGRDRLGSKDLAVGVDKIIFDCASGLGPKIIRCYYGLATGDPAAHEPKNAEVLSGQAPSGDYTGTITFSLVLK